MPVITINKVTSHLSNQLATEKSRV
uniref:Uncharacterized protein n=1 Tax=Rhizophora mucronata TaxID=61149 RepID=A0A2P2NBB7_RHIMU